MKFIPCSKVAVSPFVAVAFAVIGVTGVLLFFHVKNGPVMVLHEWFGWAFVLGGAVHLLLNFRPLLAYLRQRAGVTSLACALVLVAALFAAGLHQPAHGHHGPAGRPDAPAAAELD
jgi:hypothetical protein